MFTVRAATVLDAESCRQIYRSFVEDTPLTFETQLPSTAEMAARINAARATHAFLVLEEDGKVVGYAAARPWDARDAYAWSCETGVYLDARSHGQGGGRAVYTELLNQLQQRGYRVAVGRVVVPNDASIRLHESLGFEHAGTLRAIGWKNGEWHDVANMHKLLGDLPSPPQPIRPCA